MYLDTWAFCLCLETRQKKNNFMDPIMMDLDEEVRLPRFNSTSDSRDLNQHW